MRRLSAWIGLACGLALLLFVYRSVLFSGGQFGFRDAAHYYYPLHYKVQAEWDAGRWPLWDPSENAGMPLLGNPTAAVLYPGKLIYAALPYAWAARLYAVAHTVMAFAGMLALLRSWGASWAASTISGLSYAFGGPVLFQYCNIIFLVGAAWTPWGFLAVDRWVRLGRPGAVAGLAVVLAMQVLGGDPESAYLTGLCAGAYAIGLVWASRRRGPSRGRPWVWATVGAVTVVAWVAITLVLAAVLPGFRPEPKESVWGPFLRWFSTASLPVFRPAAFTGPVPSLPWASWFPSVVAGFWGIAGLILLIRWRRRGSSSVPLVPRLAGLAAAAVLAGAMTAAQLLPVVEFTRISGRATDEGAHDIYPFSLEPYRVAEAVWPGIFGRRFGQPTTWSELILPELSHRVWIPSLYLGGLTMVLAAGSARFRGGPPWRAWLTGIAAVSLIGSFGEWASPLWAARFVPSMARVLGPHDLRDTNAVRLDGYLRDGDGSPYFLMASLLPGFHTFRFPSKLLSFTALAVAGLAGIGWDRAVEGRSRRLGRFALAGSAATMAALVAVFAGRVAILGWFRSGSSMTVFGPLDAAGALLDTQVALIQGAAVLALAGGLIAMARRRPDLAGALALVVMAVDLGLANAPLVRTVPQSDFETTPSVLRRIAEAERVDPSPGPYRIHRMPIWNPTGWRNAISTDRVRDFVRWEHDTLQPKYGLLHGVEYTYTLGVTELYDFPWFFSPFPRSVQGDAAQILGCKPGEPMVYYPRRGFDLWGSRYFILPGLRNWNDVDRGIAAFLPQAERIYPPPEAFEGPGREEKFRRWIEDEDVQVYRNKDAFPRAWVVHEVRLKPPVVGLKRAERKETMEEILFADDPFWRDPERVLRDPRRVAWVETEDAAEVGRLPNSPPLAVESARVVPSESGPQRTVIDAVLVRPGLVILADVFYPGWRLTIDDKPAPILRANRLMRGAAVPSGRHRLVYTYEPRSFRIGGAISLAGLAALGGSLVWAFRPGLLRRPGQRPSDDNK